MSSENILVEPDLKPGTRVVFNSLRKNPTINYLFNELFLAIVPDTEQIIEVQFSPAYNKFGNYNFLVYTDHFHKKLFQKTTHNLNEILDLITKYSYEKA